MIEATNNTIKREFVPHRRVSIRICKNCGKTYILTDSSVVHFVTKFGSIPLKCEECRKKNRDSEEMTEV